MPGLDLRLTTRQDSPHYILKLREIAEARNQFESSRVVIDSHFQETMDGLDMSWTNWLKDSVMYDCMMPRVSSATIRQGTVQHLGRRKCVCTWLIVLTAMAI